jgi:PAS domain S-box-containing protein
MKVPLSKYGRVFDLIPEMIFVLNGENKIIDLNSAAESGTGFTAHELQKMGIEEIVSPGDRETLLRMIREDGKELSFETQIIRADGTRIDASFDLRILRSEQGTFHVIIARDITEEKQKELDLLRFSNVIKNTINPIQITDARGVMVYVNPAFERTSGYAKEELIGKNPNVLNSGKHSREFWRKVWEHILSGKVWVGHVENQRKDGTPFHTELVISPIVDADGRVVGFLGAHRDITEQKMLEQQLVRSQKMEAIGTLAAGIAHEVGNPLTSISSLVQVIQRTTRDEFAIEKLEMIKNQINRIAKIIRDLVDFSRPSTYVIKSSDIHPIVQDALSIVRYGKKVKNIEFVMELAEGLPKLEVVPDQLVQVFINILMNAVDSLEGRAGKITIQSWKRGNNLSVSITDSGRGIDPEAREKIFEPFYTTKEVGKGTGLGLWVSYGIVRNFGGDILVESKHGMGSTFTVVLPIKGE